MPYCHFSYDVLDCDKHFDGNYNEAKRYLICVLLSSPYIVSLESFCASTIVINLNSFDSQKLYHYLNINLSKYFYYLITLVGEKNNKADFYDNRDEELYKNFQDTLKGISCDKLKYNITL